MFFNKLLIDIFRNRIKLRGQFNGNVGTSQKQASCLDWRCVADLAVLLLRVDCDSGAGFACFQLRIKLVCRADVKKKSCLLQNVLETDLMEKLLLLIGV
jgi:hypothetical protein